MELQVEGDPVELQAVEIVEEDEAQDFLDGEGLHEDGGEYGVVENQESQACTVCAVAPFGVKFNFNTNSNPLILRNLKADI